MDKNYISIPEERFLKLVKSEIIMNDILDAFHNTKNDEDLGEEVADILKVFLLSEDIKKGD